MLGYGSANLRQAEVSGGPIEQARAQLLFQFGNCLADSGSGRFHSACRFGKTPRVDNAGEDCHQIEVGHG